jgi:hypothetical protein
VQAVTGELPPPSAKPRSSHGRSEKRILVATDCLSEGVNLQNLFTAVVHYDLSGTRPATNSAKAASTASARRPAKSAAPCSTGKTTRSTARCCRSSSARPRASARNSACSSRCPTTKASSPRPWSAPCCCARARGQRRSDRARLRRAGAGDRSRLAVAREKASANRTIFAQRRLKPEDVLPEWRKSLAVLGGEADVERFVLQAAVKLGAPLQPTKSHFKLSIDHLPRPVQERLSVDGMAGNMRIGFHQPVDPGTQFIHRTHPLVVTLADTLLERALESQSQAAETSDADAVARSGAAFVADVSLKTTVLLLRMRHQLTVTRGTQTRLMLCEEAVAVAVAGAAPLTVLKADQVRALLGTEAARNMPPPIRDRHLQQSLEALPGWTGDLEAIAQQRAQALLQDHRRIREAADAKGSYQVTASLPVDVMGIFVLVPAGVSGSRGA